MKYLFFLGKGGVGKTTLSILYSFYFTFQGIDSKLFSIDPAHNIKDILNKINIRDLINFEEMDFEKEKIDYISQIKFQMMNINKSSLFFSIDHLYKNIEEYPGFDEYLILFFIEKQILKSDKNKILIFDMPPTGLSLRILKLPYLNISYISTLIKLREQILEKKWQIAKIEQGIKNSTEDKILNKLINLKNRMKNLQNLLLDKEESQIYIIYADDISKKEMEKIEKNLIGAGFQNIKKIYNNIYNRNRGGFDIPYIENFQEVITKLKNNNFKLPL